MPPIERGAVSRAIPQDILRPNYVQVFQCQGPQCPDTCCAGWTVTVDKDSFQTYRRVTHPEIKPLLKQFLKQINAQSQKQHGVLQLQPRNGQCGLLADSGWCRIQEILGEEALCDTCYSYPRHTVQVNGQTEQYLTLSCPEAARLALTLPQAFEFTSDQSNIRAASALAIRGVHGFAPESVSTARLFAVQLCQTDGLSLTEKLLALGWLCQQIDLAINEARWDGIEPLVADMVALVEQGQLREQARQLSTQTTVGATVFATLFADATHPNASAQQKRVLDAVRSGLELDQAQGAPIDDCYRRGLEKLNQDGGRSEATLSRYVLNEVLREIFPWQETTCLAHFQKLVARYGMVRLMLAGVAATNPQPLDSDTLVQVIQVFARNYQHNDRFVDKVQRVLTQANWTQLSHLYALLR